MLAFDRARLMFNELGLSSLAGGMVVALLLWTGCGTDPNINDLPNKLVVELYPNPDFAKPTDPAQRACRTQAVVGPTPTECVPLSNDFIPGQPGRWPACISDDGIFRPINPSIGSIARVEAFEEIAKLIFDPSRDPSADDFTQARMIYQRDEGIDSRAVRRYDPHFCAPEPGFSCRTAGVPAQYPDYCVGPAKLQPIFLESLNGGIDQKPLSDGSSSTRVYAARIEAGFIWLFYISSYKESLTCGLEAKADCDSSYAYYSGARPRGLGIGLSRYVREVDPEADERALNGGLAVRCWREQDTDLPGTNLELRERARDQFDRAVQKGVAEIVRDRLQRLQDAGDTKVKTYYWEFVRVLGPVLDHEARLRNATLADELKAAFRSSNYLELDIAKLRQTIRTLFPCA